MPLLLMDSQPPWSIWYGPPDYSELYRAEYEAQRRRQKQDDELLLLWWHMLTTKGE